MSLFLPQPMYVSGEAGSSDLGERLKSSLATRIEVLRAQDEEIKIKEKREKERGGRET